MNNKKLIKQIAKYAIRHNCEVTLQAKDEKSNSKVLIVDSGTTDTGLELWVIPKGEEK